MKTKLFITLFISFIFSACAKPGLKSTEVSHLSKSESYKKNERETAFGPNPIQLFPVVLVFGPAQARGFAYAGIIKGFTEEKIPIGAIVGADFGALIGAIYTHSETVHEFEWKVLKIG